MLIQQLEKLEKFDTKIDAFIRQDIICQLNTVEKQR